MNININMNWNSSFQQSLLTNQYITTTGDYCSNKDYFPNGWVDNLVKESSFLTKPIIRSNSTQSDKLYLDEFYFPSEWDVICGRGKHSYNHIGNRRFRVLVAMNLPRFVKAKTKEEKSAVVDSVVDQIHDASPYGGFIQQDPVEDGGRWYEIGKQMACKKVAHSFRDAMTGKLRQRCCSTWEDMQPDMIASQNRLFRSCRLFSKKR